KFQECLGLVPLSLACPLLRSATASPRMGRCPQIQNNGSANCWPEILVDTTRSLSESPEWKSPLAERRPRTRFVSARNSSSTVPSQQSSLSAKPGKTAPGQLSSDQRIG